MVSDRKERQRHDMEESYRIVTTFYGLRLMTSCLHFESVISHNPCLYLPPWTGEVLLGLIGIASPFTLTFPHLHTVTPTLIPSHSHTVTLSHPHTFTPAYLPSLSPFHALGQICTLTFPYHQLSCTHAVYTYTK